MSGRQTFLKDKPYEFVPLLGHCDRINYNKRNANKDTYSGRLILKITVLTPLHIGSSLIDYDRDGNVIKKQMRRNGKLIIPGSSLKGAVRSVAEAVSYSCAVKVPDSVLKNALPKGNREICSDAGNLCMTCFMFGMMGKPGSCKGKVRFGEFELESGGAVEKQIPLLESPFKNYPKPHDMFGYRASKSNYGNERLYYCKACEAGNCEECSKEDYLRNKDIAGKTREIAFRGRKFYSTSREYVPESRKLTNYEMIKPDSVLTGEILFENLRQEEGRLLAYALDLGHHFAMKLGYGKPLGYGKVKIDLEGVENPNNRYPSKWKADKEVVERWAQEYRENSTDAIKGVIRELERIMNYAEGSDIKNGH